MARQFPRFLVSNPEDTKSEGPFIVHTLFPRFIARVVFGKKNYPGFDIELLECWDDVDPETYIPLKGQAATWVKSQLSKEVFRINKHLSKRS